MANIFKLFNPETGPSNDELSATYRRFCTEFIGAENFTKRILQDFGPDIVNYAPPVPPVPQNAAEPAQLFARKVPEQVKVVGLIEHQEQAESIEQQQHVDLSRAQVETAFLDELPVNEADTHEFRLPTENN